MGKSKDDWKTSNKVISHKFKFGEDGDQYDVHELRNRVL